MRDRAILEISPMDRISNEVVRQRTKVNDIALKIRKMKRPDRSAGELMVDGADLFCNGDHVKASVL